MVLFFVFFCYFFLVLIKYGQKVNFSYKLVEFFCTFFPILILVLQIIPSLFLLFERSFNTNRFLSLKVIAHQWY